LSAAVAAWRRQHGCAGGCAEVAASLVAARAAWRQCSGNKDTGSDSDGGGKENNQQSTEKATLTVMMTTIKTKVMVAAAVAAWPKYSGYSGSSTAAVAAAWQRCGSMAAAAAAAAVAAAAVRQWQQQLGGSAALGAVAGRRAAWRQRGKQGQHWGGGKRSLKQCEERWEGGVGGQNVCTRSCIDGYRGISSAKMLFCPRNPQKIPPSSCKFGACLSVSSICHTMMAPWVDQKKIKFKATPIILLF
jgi:hypothetical protein